MKAKTEGCKYCSVKTGLTWANVLLADNVKARRLVDDKGVVHLCQDPPLKIPKIVKKYAPVEYPLDKDMPITHLFNYIALMERKHGVKSTVNLEAGKLVVTPSKMSVVLCPKCRSRAGVKPDGTLANHSFRDGYKNWIHCQSSGSMYEAPKK